MTGREMTPIATTLAPTTPVDAARSAPTSTVEMAIPPRISPNKNPIDSSRRSASRDFCKTIPIKMKSGIAISMVLFMIDQMRCGIREKICVPSANRPKKTATPPKVKATGKPRSSIARAVVNIIRPIISDVFPFPLVRVSENIRTPVRHNHQLPLLAVEPCSSALQDRFVFDMMHRRRFDPPENINVVKYKAYG